MSGYGMEVWNCEACFPPKSYTISVAVKVWDSGIPVLIYRISTPVYFSEVSAVKLP